MRNFDFLMTLSYDCQIKFNEEFTIKIVDDKVFMIEQQFIY